jgi:hypothetical protein
MIHSCWPYSTEVAIIKYERNKTTCWNLFIVVTFIDINVTKTVEDKERLWLST